MNQLRRIYIVRHPNDQVANQPPVNWALGELERAMNGHSVSTRYGETIAQTSPDETCIVVAGAEADLARPILNAAGVAVPKPISHSDNAILMEYIGDEESAAPMLRQVDLSPEEAPQLFDFLLDNIECCLAVNCIHADLSPYNALYWNESLTIIDLPQAVDPRFNPNAYFFLRRDIENVCRHWAKYGVRHDPFQLAEDLWRR